MKLRNRLPRFQRSETHLSYHIGPLAVYLAPKTQANRLFRCSLKGIVNALPNVKWLSSRISVIHDFLLPLLGHAVAVLVTKYLNLDSRRRATQRKVQ